MSESWARVRDAAARLPAPAWPIALVLAAALLRSWHLDHMSIWQDEGLSFYRATQDLRQLLSGHIPLGDLITTDTHPPLYFLLLAGWFKLVGVSAWTAKWFSMLAGLPTIVLVWALARRTVGARAARAAGLLAALAPIYLWYAQEVRSYTLTVTLGAMAVYSMLRGVDDRASSRSRVRWGVAMVLSTAALLWTHFLGFFVAALAGLVIVVHAAHHRGRRAVPVLAGFALVALAAVPLLPNVLWRLGLGAERDQHFVALPIMLHDIVRGFGVGRTFAGVPSGAAGGPVAGAVTALGWIGALLAVAYVALLVVGTLAAWRRSPLDAMLLVGYLLLPVVGLFALTLIKPVYLGPQHILLASPAFFVLVGAGLAWVIRHRCRAGLATCCALIVTMLWAGLNFYADPVLAKNDLRGLAAYVEARAVPGDVLVVSDPVLERSFEQLISRVPVIAVPRMLENGLLDERPAEAQIAPLLLEHGRLWFMTPLDEHQPWLEAHALLVDREWFHGGSIPVRVDAYEKLPSDRRGTMPPRAGWETDPMLGGIRLKGWEAVPDPLLPGQAGRVRLVWQALGESVPDYKVSVRLLDATGRDYALGDHEPYHGEYPTSSWPTGELTYEPHDLLVSPGAPPGEYRLAVSVYDPATGEVFPEEGSLEIGTVHVDRPPDALGRPDVIPDHRLAARGGGIELLGYDLPAGPWAPGAELPLTVWWRAIDDNPEGLLGAEIVDAHGRERGSDAASIPDTLGSAAPWDDLLVAGDVRSTPLRIRLPAESGTYGLRLRHSPIESPALFWHRRLLPVRAIWLGDVVVEELDRQRDLPIMQQQLQLDVGDHVALMGYDSPAIVPGAAASVSLYWRARDAVPVGYHVTVQLVPTGDGVGPSGPPVAQHDGIPEEGSRPTTGWLPGEIVVDRHTLAVPVDLSPGRYLLIAALYDPNAPELPRPAVEQDGLERDYVLLEVIDVPLAGSNGTTP